eukprot:gene20144-biopygen16952
MTQAIQEAGALASVRQRLAAAEADGQTEYECMGRDFVVHEGVFPPTHFQSTGIFTRHLPYPRGGRFLEIGCGAGNFLRQAAARGFDITGLEYSPYAAERARKTLEGRGRILHGEIGVLAAERDAYDVVVLCDVIEHVRHPADFLRDLHRLLKPGG